MTDHPKSPGEAPFCFGFAFDVGQLAELADEAMLFSAAAPESEARRIEGAARLAAASGFLGALLLKAGWTPAKFSRLLESSANAGVMLFHQASGETGPEEPSPCSEAEPAARYAFDLDLGHLKALAALAGGPEIEAGEPFQTGVISVFSRLCAAAGMVGATISATRAVEGEALDRLAKSALQAGAAMAHADEETFPKSAAPLPAQSLH